MCGRGLKTVVHGELLRQAVVRWSFAVSRSVHDHVSGFIVATAFIVTACHCLEAASRSLPGVPFPEDNRRSCLLFVTTQVFCIIRAVALFGFSGCVAFSPSMKYFFTGVSVW